MRANGTATIRIVSVICVTRLGEILVWIMKKGIKMKNINLEIAKGGIGGKEKHNRSPMDFYSTPRDRTEALIDFLEERGEMYPTMKIWEPACGEGAICQVLTERRYVVVASDIREDCKYGNGGVDFLTCNGLFFYNMIITNPPFNVSEAFINKCMGLGVPFALLLKSQYWHSKKRLALFRQRKPKYVCPLTWRPSFIGKANLMDFIWTIWDKDNVKDTRYFPLEKPIQRK